VYELPVGRAAVDDREPAAERDRRRLGSESDRGAAHGPPGAIEQTNLTNTYSTSQRPKPAARSEDFRRPPARAPRWRSSSTPWHSRRWAGIFGNAARESGFGPGYVGMDASLHKRFPIREGMGLQFRGDFYNLQNRPNFANPSATRGRADFGTISAIAPGTNGRLIQLGMRLEF
jgi:hypothetical protein